MSAVQLRSYAEVARHVGVSSRTVQDWAAKGWLSGAGPWSAADARAAAARSRQRGGRGPSAAHRSASRWRAGCRCAECRAAHGEATKITREAARAAWWESREAPLLEALAGGARWADALAVVGATSPAVTGHRRRSVEFAAALDAALLEGRDPAIEHGTASAWRAGCRCPECREHHEGTRR